MTDPMAIPPMALRLALVAVGLGLFPAIRGRTARLAALELALEPWRLSYRG